MAYVELTVVGMSCGHCIAAVRGALEAQPSVQVNAVNVGAAEVFFDSAVVTAERLRAAVEEAGYEARIARES